MFLVSCCPEAFVSILLCEKLNDHEIVILRGCRRFIDYAGYGDTFRYKSRYSEDDSIHIQDILVIDACFYDQFTEKMIDRDLGKAWAAFQKSRNQRIVTGHWGCGVFGGDFYLKFLQQVCAAMILGEDFKILDYSVYGDQNLESNFKDLLKELEQKKKTVADIYEIMHKYRNHGLFPGSHIPFREYLHQWLNSSE